jgi:hypothetical protein
VLGDAAQDDPRCPRVVHLRGRGRRMLHFHQEREREREREREVCGEIWLDSGEGWQLVRPVLGFFKGSA